MKITTKTLFKSGYATNKSGYATNSSTMIQSMMICILKTQYMLCALIYACKDYQK